MTTTRALAIGLASLAFVACTSSGGTPQKTGTAGTGAGSAGSGGAGTTGAAGSTGVAGTGPAAGSTGSAGSGGSSGEAGTSGGAGSSGAAGKGTDGGAGSSSSDGSADRGEVAGPVTTAGCANHNYQLCIDFEDGIDTKVWSGGTPNAIVTSDAAHGTHSYRLYTSCTGGNCEAKGGRLLSKIVGTIKNQVWARFYIHFKPGAPGGHGNIIAAYDTSGAWYELGYQFDAMMGVWHGGGGENPLRSMPLIVDKWYCVEAYFDGTAVGMAPRWWIDGSEAQYYMPGGGPKIAGATQFTRMEAGFTPYASLDLKMPDGKGDQTETRVLTDLWIDDIAFDTQRIGCIE